MKKSRRKLNNAGMSLVEIIVVVLIMGVLSAGAVVGLSFIRSMDASSAAESLVAALNRAKLQTQATNTGETIKLQIVAESDGYYGKILLVNGASTTELDKVEIGDNALTISFAENDTDTPTTIDSSHPCVIEYAKSNGAYDSDYTKLVVNGSKTMVVRMVKATGRCYIE